MMMPTAWNIEKQALDVTSEYGLDERVSINDAYGMATVNLSSKMCIRDRIISARILLNLKKTISAWENVTEGYFFFGSMLLTSKTI